MPKVGLKLVLLLSHSRALHSLVFSVILSLAAPSVAASETANQLLAKMLNAGEQLSYKGVFTYQAGRTMNTIKLIHANRDGVVYERLYHMTGPRREVIRHGVSCHAAGVGRLLASLDAIGRDSSFSDHYQLHIGDKQRVAGRQITQLQVIPNDADRFGYILGIDNKTGLMLQAMLVSEQRQVLELFQFVDVEIGALIEDAELMPSNANYQDANEDGDCAGSEAQQQTAVAWRPSWVPPGFELTGSHREKDDAKEVLTYSDGIAVFSLFIDPVSSVMLPPAVNARAGATSLALEKVQAQGREYAVSVVGEIPELTARRIAQSVVYAQ